MNTRPRQTWALALLGVIAVGTLVNAAWMLAA